ncbi:MAG: cobalamin biosynthesis protein [Candidatus Acididesulfobacter guangdongensis]|uniref:Cobalamin biosynthesis protein n=1 Tax=Acididesulfobacter guangdongensis TaxID=2597225 RepID=A0A519BFX0_ACIG2|nr:MAG: cobalamin biosynthesis protein [Candidatus Acididesulfobacter guangdongensis]
MTYNILPPFQFCRIILFSAVILSFLYEYYITGKLRYRFHILNIIAYIVKFLERIMYNFSNKYLGGVLFTILSLLIAAFLSVIIGFILAQISIWLLVIFFIFILSSFLSSGGLNHAALTVYHDLKNDGISRARTNLKALAGRDSENMNESEISRAVVESVAENTGDGIGSLVFYTAAGFAVGRLSVSFDFYDRYCAKSAAFLSSLFYYLMATLYGIAGAGLPSINMHGINFNGYSGNNCGIILTNMLIFGIAGAVIYKTSNLMDSLVGYKNKKYIKFGKFSARLDDVLNYVPFRITAVFMLFSLIILNFFYKNKKSYNNNQYKNLTNNNACRVYENNKPDKDDKSKDDKHENNHLKNKRGSYYNKLYNYNNNYDFNNAVKSWRKFRKMHPSPNAGQLEAIMAGALKVRLGGTNYYGGIESNRPVIGFENYDYANTEDIMKSLNIMRITSIILIISLCFVGLILF